MLKIRDIVDQRKTVKDNYKMKLIIIGAGPGGYETAVLAARKGIDVTLVEASRPGGTCLNVGCIPTKALCRSAELLESLRHAEEAGVCSLEYRFDFGRACDRKDAVVDQLRAGLASLLANPRITLVHGRASFIDNRTVSVDTGEGTPSVVSGDKVIIATGSVPAMLDIPGNDSPAVVTSDGLLECREVPRKLCIIGAGVIGLEFASIFRSFGSEVTVVEYCKEILPRFDKDIAKRLRQSLSSRGIEFCLGAAVKEIVPSVKEIVPAETCGDDGISETEVTDNIVKVVFEKKGVLTSCEADKVLMAVGRRPALGSLNLDDIGVEYTPKGIVTDAFMQTNVPGVYAIGDITGGVMLAHAASMQGEVALSHILGEESKVDLSVMPAAVFTMPEAASVGLTEAECSGCICRKSFFRANGKALCSGETEGMCKIVADGSGRLVGCHIFGPHASDLIHEAAAMILRRATLDDIRDMVHVHPTLSEVFRDACR